jgi:hypothetical protein
MGANKSSKKAAAEVQRRGSLMRDTGTNFLKGEDTKVNFYNPENKDIGLYEIPNKPEDERILETRIDPLEWKQEIDRVYRDLVNIEKEIEVMKNQGGEYHQDFEECRRHIELIIEMCNDIRQSSHHEVRKVFASSAEKLEDDLSFIRKNEIRINKQNEKAIT